MVHAVLVLHGVGQAGLMGHFVFVGYMNDGWLHEMRQLCHELRAAAVHNFA